MLTDWSHQLTSHCQRCFNDGQLYFFRHHFWMLEQWTYWGWKGLRIYYPGHDHVFLLIPSKLNIKKLLFAVIMAPVNTGGVFIMNSVHMFAYPYEQLCERFTMMWNTTQSWYSPGALGFNLKKCRKLNFLGRLLVFPLVLKIPSEEFFFIQEGRHRC